MKRYGQVLLVTLLVLVAASAALAVFPTPDTTVTLPMGFGWAEGRPAWYVCTDTNNLQFVRPSQIPGWQLTLAPPLSSAFPGVGARLMFVVTNPTQAQGPIFETFPGHPYYTPVWVVTLLTWQPGVQQVPITSINQIISLENAGKIVRTQTNARVDCSIVAYGPLGGPCSPNTPLIYRIGQCISINTYAKTIALPAWYVFCQDCLTRAIQRCTVIIPDVGSQALAQVLKANYAPNLQLYPFSDTQRFYAMREPKPPTQLPVIQECPNGIGAYNTNRWYVPVMQYTLLHRPNIPPYVVINNAAYLEKLPLIIASQDTRINAPVLECTPLSAANGGCP